MEKRFILKKTPSSEEVANQADLQEGMSKSKHKKKGHALTTVDKSSANRIEDEDEEVMIEAQSMLSSVHYHENHDLSDIMGEMQNTLIAADSQSLMQSSYQDKPFTLQNQNTLQFKFQTQNSQSPFQSHTNVMQQ